MFLGSDGQICNGFCIGFVEKINLGCSRALTDRFVMDTALVLWRISTWRAQGSHTIYVCNLTKEYGITHACMVITGEAPANNNNNNNNNNNLTDWVAMLFAQIWFAKILEMRPHSVPLSQIIQDKLDQTAFDIKPIQSWPRRLRWTDVQCQQWFDDADDDDDDEGDDDNDDDHHHCYPSCVCDIDNA